MAHVRTQIRDVIATTIDGLATTGTNVYTSRVYPLDADGGEIPGHSISTLRDYENEERSEDLGQRQIYTYEVMIESHAMPPDGGDSLDDIADQMEAELVAALMADNTLGGKVEYLKRVTSSVEDSGELQRPTVKLVSIWRMDYAILASDAETLIYAT